MHTTMRQCDLWHPSPSLKNAMFAKGGAYFEEKARVSVSLSSSAGVHLILIWVPPAAALNKHMQRDDEISK